jgi:uncharacterized membrane protein
MLYLTLGVLLFGGAHLASILLPAPRDKLREDWGRGRYMGIYSLVSLAGLVFLVFGYVEGRSGGATAQLLYEPWSGARHMMMTLVLIGFVLIFSNKSKGYIAKTLRNPFSIGIALWSLGHLLVNGEIYAVVIFGLFLVVSLFDIGLSELRGKRLSYSPNWKHDLRGLVVGVVLFGVFAFGFHPYVLGIPVVG